MVGTKRPGTGSLLPKCNALQCL